MARARLTLDTRNKSKKPDGFYPIVLRVFHRKPRMIRMNKYTSMDGWDDAKMELKKSALANRDLDCDKINIELYDKLHIAKSIINGLGDTLRNITADILIETIKNALDDALDSELKKNLSNPLTINEWCEVLVERKLKEQEPGTAKWY
ncbi:MAG: hypothetical protein WBG48_03805, partial [Pricia sp.]